MKVVAYSIKTFEKEYLAKANQKKHDITLISNPLSLETAVYAEGKDAVVVFTNDEVSAPVVNKLADLGIKYIATRSVGTDHIDKEAAALRSIMLANVPSYSPEAIAEHAVALVLALNRHVVLANQNSHLFDFRLDKLIGFNLSGKTIGLIGLGHIGHAAAKIFKGFGCRVIAYDIALPDDTAYVEMVSLDDLLALSDIISLHAPLNPSTTHLISTKTIHQMKEGVMLINTSRGGLIHTEDVLEALYTGKIGYLGIDVYEYEKGVFFEDHSKNTDKDKLLEHLIAHPNVLVTPHQAFLTHEALQQIADKTIMNLDLWQANKCAGDACACSNNCTAKNSVNKVVIDVNTLSI